MRGSILAPSKINSNQSTLSLLPYCCRFGFGCSKRTFVEYNNTLVWTRTGTQLNHKNSLRYCWPTTMRILGKSQLVHSLMKSRNQSQPRILLLTSSALLLCLLFLHLELMILSFCFPDVRFRQKNLNGKAFSRSVSPFSASEVGKLANALVADEKS